MHISEIPPEIFVHVFQHLADGGRRCEDYEPAKDLGAGPILKKPIKAASMVCRQWYQFIHSQSSLFVLVFDLGSQLKALEEAHRRAATYPIYEIQLGITHLTNNPPLKLLLDLLRAWLPRLYAATCRVTSLDPFVNFFHTQSLPRLQFLRVLFTGSWNPISPILKFSSQRTPNLSVLSLPKLPIKLEKSSIIQSLTTLSLDFSDINVAPDFLNWDEMWEALQACTSLESFSLACSTIWNPDLTILGPEQPSRINIPSLRALLIRTEPSIVILCLYKLTLFGLEHLSIHTNRLPVPDTFQVEHRSCFDLPMLQSLEIRTLCLEFAQLLADANMPVLTELSILNSGTLELPRFRAPGWPMPLNLYSLRTLRVGASCELLHWLLMPLATAPTGTLNSLTLELDGPPGLYRIQELPTRNFKSLHHLSISKLSFPTLFFYLYRTLPFVTSLEIYVERSKLGPYLPASYPLGSKLSTLLPGLCTVTLHLASLGDEVSTHLQYIAHSVGKRKEDGFPIATLCIDVMPQEAVKDAISDAVENLKIQNIQH